MDVFVQAMICWVFFSTNSNIITGPVFGGRVSTVNRFRKYFGQADDNNRSFRMEHLEEFRGPAWEYTHLSPASAEAYGIVPFRCLFSCVQELFCQYPGTTGLNR